MAANTSIHLSLKPDRAPTANRRITQRSEASGCSIALVSGGLM